MIAIITKIIITKFSHIGIINWFRDRLRNGALQFNEVCFQDIHTYKDIDSWQSKSGENLKGNLDDDKRFKQLIKKISEYKLENEKRKFPRNRRKISSFKEANFVFLMEFFYMYRVKSNYRHLDTLEDSNDKTIQSYCSMYHQVAINMFSTLKKLINDLSTKRFGSHVFN